jgi:hypothetical protein
MGAVGTLALAAVLAAQPPAAERMDVTLRVGGVTDKFAHSSQAGIIWSPPPQQTSLTLLHRPT